MTLRGVSLFWSQWAPDFYNAALVAWLARDWRIDVIRIPVAAANPGYLSDPDGEMRKVRAVVEAAVANEIYAIIDWHAHDPHTAEARYFFRSVAATYGDCPNLLYETWNEPGPRYRWADDIKPHHEKMLEVIRRYAPNAPVIIGTPDFCSDLSVVQHQPLDGENIAYAFHFYCATHRDGLRQRVQAAFMSGASLFASEWGLGDASGGGPLDVEEARRWLQFLNERQIGHVNWSIYDKDEACAALRPGASPNGRWRRSLLSPSGRVVRSYLKRSLRAA